MEPNLEYEIMKRSFNNFDHGIFRLVLAIVVAVAVIALLSTFFTIIIPHPHVTANGPQPMAHTDSHRERSDPIIPICHGSQCVLLKHSKATQAKQNIIIL